MSPVSGYDEMDPISLRRGLARYRAPRPSWDIGPEDRAPSRQPAQPMAAGAGTPAPAGGQVGTFRGGGTYASTGDPIYDAIRNQTMADAAARTRGTRAAAIRAGGDDPSLAAYGGLLGLSEGQGDAATALNRGALERMNEIDRRKYQEYILRLQHEWAMQQQRDAARNALYGGLGQIGGAVLGAAIP